MKRASFLFAGLLGALLVLVTACGGGDDGTATPTGPTQTTAPTVAPTTAPTSAPTVAPTAAPTIAPTSAPTAMAPELEISPVGDQLLFNTGSYTVSEGATVVLTLDNSSTIFQHNWVVVQNGTKDAVAAAGALAGPTNDYVPTGDDQVVANTRLLNPGETGEVRFTAPPAGTYQFVCTFPGHNFTMFGDFIVTQ